MAAALPFFRRSESVFVGPRNILSQDTAFALAASATTDFFQFISIPLGPKQAVFIELATVAAQIEAAGLVTLGLVSLRIGAGTLILDVSAATSLIGASLRPARNTVLSAQQILLSTDDILRVGGTPSNLQIQVTLTGINGEAIPHTVTVFQRIIARIINGLGE